MIWLEILIEALVIVLLLAILITTVQLKNLLKHMLSSLQRDVESSRKEVQADIQELRIENKETLLEGACALASARKLMLDDLDVIYKFVKDISESKGDDLRRSRRTKPT